MLSMLDSMHYMRQFNHLSYFHRVRFFFWRRKRRFGLTALAAASFWTWGNQLGFVLSAAERNFKK